LYLLDTNVISELRKPRPHGAVLAWLDGTADEELHLSAMTLGELQAGVEITREHNPDKAAEIEVWIDHVAQTLNVLPVDARVFRTWAKLMHRRPDHLFEDALIARHGDRAPSGRRDAKRSSPCCLRSRDIQSIHDEVKTPERGHRSSR
jgi:predicted nucleic acid-binding protein